MFIDLISFLTAFADREERDEPTPPISPFILSEGTSGTGKSKQNITVQKSQQSRKYQDSSLEADDTESELVAIPESDLSESTLHNSAPGSFDDHFDEIAMPLRSDAKGKVTTANISTAQVALGTIGVSQDEKPEPKKTSRLFMKLNSLDKLHDKSLQKSQSGLSTGIVTKCSLQEGVRMMVTPSIFMPPQQIEKPILSEEVSVQKAIVVTQDIKSNVDTKETKSTELKGKDLSEVDSGPVKSATIVNIASLLAESSSTVAKQIAVGPVKSSK